ncbi:hypothetical protein Tco_0571802 [Tanacetum coccineum]
MEDSWKSMDLNKFVVKDDMIDYDKRKATEIKILELLEQRIEKVGKHLNKEKQIMDINKGRENGDGKSNVDLETKFTNHILLAEVIIIESDTSCDHKPFQVTYGESYDHNPFKVTSDESSDHNPFQTTSNESSDHNPFQVSFEDTLKSSSEDTRSYDSTWEQKKLLDVNHGLDIPKRKKSFDGKQGSSFAKAKKDSILSEIIQWYDDLSSDEQRTIYKGVEAVKTWQQILNKEFEIKRFKENVGGSSDVRRKGNKKML